VFPPLFEFVIAFEQCVHDNRKYAKLGNFKFVLSKGFSCVEGSNVASRAPMRGRHDATSVGAQRLCPDAHVAPRQMPRRHVSLGGGEVCVLLLLLLLLRELLQRLLIRRSERR
jgi:hypothetical protein